MVQRSIGHCKDRGDYVLIKDVEALEDPQLTMFNRPLPCFGCGIGWSHEYSDHINTYNLFSINYPVLVQFQGFQQLPLPQYLRMMLSMSYSVWLNFCFSDSSMRFLF